MTHIQAAAMQPAWPGCFLLPVLDEQVPVALGSEHLRARLLARFAKISAEEGVPLPVGASYHAVEKVVTAQWQQYVDAAFGDRPIVSGKPTVVVRDDCIGLRVDALSNLNVFQLKPVITALEKSRRGLGWFVLSVLETCRSHGHEFYDMCLAAWVLDPHHGELDRFTDEAYVRFLINYEGLDISEDEITPEVIEKLKPDYMFWPSDVLETVDGHAHLLGRVRSPKPMSARSAKKWLADHAREPFASVVQLATQLKAEFAADKDRAFVWSRSLTDQDEDVQPIGAAAFLAWDDPALLLELVQHHEEYAYNGGGGAEEYARSLVRGTDLEDDADLRKLVHDAKRYFKRWGLINQLLTHFPIWEEYDEA